MLDLTRPPPDRPASATRRIELHSRITSANDAPAPRSGFHDKAKRDAVIRQVLNTTGPVGEWVDLPQHDGNGDW